MPRKSKIDAHLATLTPTERINIEEEARRREQFGPAYIARSSMPSTTTSSAGNATMIKIGDVLPNIELIEDKPGEKVSVAGELRTQKGMIIGVPAAFSPSCTNTHVPDFLAHAKLEEAGKVFVVSVNDPFVMAAWGKILKSNTNNEAAKEVRFLADPTGKFTRGIGMEFPCAPVFGTNRSKRCIIRIEDGKVTEVVAEKDHTGVKLTTAAKILGETTEETGDDLLCEV